MTHSIIFENIKEDSQTYSSFDVEENEILNEILLNRLRVPNFEGAVDETQFNEVGLGKRINKLELKFF